MDNFFRIEKLSCGYNNKFNISDISMEIDRGMLVGIIGPNGCGKTTLLKGITGELKNKSGNVTLNGKTLNKISYREKARIIAVVSQDIEVPEMPVDEYILMGRMPYHNNFQFFDTKEDIAISENYMNLTQVDHLKNKYLNRLSGGERQMISITRALVQEPELLLLDEPTSHLDITHQVKVLNLVQRMNEQFGLTVLMVIHDLNLAGEYCNKLIMLNNGKIHTTGTPDEVLTYTNIEEVYKTVVVTKTNPVSEKPLVCLVSEKILKMMNEKNLKI